MVREDLKKEGYDREEEYFHKLEQEKLEKMRQKLKETEAAEKTKKEKNVPFED